MITKKIFTVLYFISFMLLYFDQNKIANWKVKTISNIRKLNHDLDSELNILLLYLVKKTSYLYMNVKNDFYNLFCLYYITVYIFILIPKLYVMNNCIYIVLKISVELFHYFELKFVLCGIQSQKHNLKILNNILIKFLSIIR